LYIFTGHGFMEFIIDYPLGANLNKLKKDMAVPENKQVKQADIKKSGKPQDR